MNRPVIPASATHPPAGAVPDLLLAVGTPFGDWHQGLAPALLHSVASRLDLSDQSLTNWLDQVVGDAAAQGAADSVWSLDPAKLGASAVASLSDLASARPGRSAGACDARAGWVLGAIRQALPRARYLVFVGSPVDALASWMQSEADLDVSAFLDRWCDSAAALLELLLASPGAALFVDAGEAHKMPAGLAKVAAGAFGLPFEVSGKASGTTDLDILALAAARGLVEGHARCAALHLQLQGACVVLHDAAASPKGRLLNIQPDLDPGKVVDAYRSTTLGARHHAQLERQIGAMRATLVASESERNTLAEQAARAERCAGELDAQRRDNELLQAQARQVLDELEFYHAARGKSTQVGAEPAIAGLDFADIQFGPVEVGDPRDTPPHRELTAQWQSLRLGDRSFPSLEARLVEHHGRAGMVVFADAGRGPITAWSESGAEDGRGFMLIIPSDTATLQATRRFSATDWRFVLSLVQAIGQAAAAAGLPAFWRHTASRLLQELLDLPQVFRFDELQVVPADDPDTVELDFGRSISGARSLGDVRLQWVRGGSASSDRLALLRPRGGVLPPWASWPVAVDGQLSTAWDLPVCGAADDASKRRQWQTMTASDRAALMALLSALPRLAGDDRWPDAQPLAARLAAAADDARRMATPTRLRQMVRLLRGETTA